jgi:hypothetical protein
MLNLPSMAAEIMKVTRQAPSSARTVFTTQWNCCADAASALLPRAPLKEGQKIHRKMVPIWRQPTTRAARQLSHGMCA